MSRKGDRQLAVLAACDRANSGGDLNMTTESFEAINALRSRALSAETLVAEHKTSNKALIERLRTVTRTWRVAAGLIKPGPLSAQHIACADAIEAAVNACLAGAMTERYRTGRKLGRTIYFNDKLIGMMDHESWAREVVRCLNESALVSSNRTADDCPQIGCTIEHPHSHDDGGPEKSTR